MNDTISHAFIPGRLAKQKVVQAELEEKLSKSEESLTVAQTKSNVSKSFHRKRSQVESIGVKHHNLVKHEPCLDIKAKPLPFVRNLLGVQKVSIKVTQLTLFLKRKKLHTHLTLSHCGKRWTYPCSRTCGPKTERPWKRWVKWSKNM